MPVWCRKIISALLHNALHHTVYKCGMEEKHKHKNEGVKRFKSYMWSNSNSTTLGDFFFIFYKIFYMLSCAHAECGTICSLSFTLSGLKKLALKLIRIIKLILNVSVYGEENLRLRRLICINFVCITAKFIWKLISSIEKFEVRILVNWVNY